MTQSSIIELALAGAGVARAIPLIVRAIPLISDPLAAYRKPSPFERKIEWISQPK
jgi:hypothetical protein